MVRNVRDQTGRFDERPHYEPKELDILFEKIIIDFIKSRHGKIEFPIATDDLTVLIERDTEDLDAYADLKPYGNGVEGVTEFRPGKKPRVRISQDLGSSDARENRFRTTLTHEYGHVHLHGYLFALGGKGPGLFDGGKKKTDIIACKRDTMVSAKQTDWMEWQAGYACGAILMPVTHIRSAIAPYQKQANIYGALPAMTPQGQAMIDLVVERFQVSRDAARVRLSVLGILGAASTSGSLPL